MSYTSPLYRSTRRPNVFTFQDAFDHLTNFVDVDNVGRHALVKRQSVIESWLEFPQLWEWAHLTRNGQIVTAAPYSTGTVEYTHSSRTLTLTGGTWPTDITSRWIKIGSISYPVESRTSGTVVILPERYNPGADVAALTTYQAFLRDYPLDVDVSQIGPLKSVNGVEPMFVDASQLENLRERLGDPGTPMYYSLVGGGVIGQPVISFVPAPSVADSYQFWCRTRPRALRTWGGAVSSCEYTTGTVATAASATVTGTGTAWTSDMIGSVMRFTQSTTVVPTGLIGVSGASNPFTEFRVVKSVTSGTVLVLDEAVEGTYSAMKYSIGDPVDLNQELWTLFLRQCERKFCNLAPKLERLSLVQANYQEALRLAKAADNTRNIPLPAPEVMWTVEQYVRNSRV